MRRRIAKKGQSHWVSWILLSALTVIITTFMYSWMTGYADESSSNILKTFENTEECDNVAIQIDACQSTSRNVVYANATNRGFLKIDRLMFQLFDAHGDAINRGVNETIRPNTMKRLTIIRQDIVEHMEAVPVIVKDEHEVVCTKRAVTVENMGTC